MDLRAQLENWQRQLGSSRTAVAVIDRGRKLLRLGKRACKELSSIGCAAAAGGAHWRKQLALLTGRLGRQIAGTLSAASDRLSAWCRQAMASRRVPTLIAESQRAWRRAGAGIHAIHATLHAWVGRMEVAAGSVRGRLAQSSTARRATHAVARLRAGPLAPVAARVDSWIAGRRRAAQGRYRIEVATERSRAFAIGGACLTAVLFALPALAGRNLINELIFVFTMLVLAQYWNLLAGYAGLVSVGQQAFVGLGGYSLFALTIHAGLDPLAAIVAAGLFAAVLAVPTALVVFRLRGAYFAVGTWVVAEVYRLAFAQFKALGGGTGMSLPPFVTNEVAGIASVKALFGVSTSAARDIITYWAALTLAVGTVVLIYLLLRSRDGLALAAIRDSERAAESIGVDNFKTKLKVYIIAAAGTGMIGALTYLQKAHILPESAFSLEYWTAYVIFIVVIGGIGTIEGPIVGVLVFYVLQTNLAQHGTWYLILLGLFAIVAMLFAPKGIWGYLSERYGLVLFPIRRRLIANAPSSSTSGVVKTTSKPGD